MWVACEQYAGDWRRVDNRPASPAHQAGPRHGPELEEVTVATCALRHLLCARRTGVVVLLDPRALAVGCLDAWLPTARYGRCLVQYLGRGGGGDGASLWLCHWVLVGCADTLLCDTYARTCGRSTINTNK